MISTGFHSYISFQSLGLTQSNLMDLYLLSRSVVGAEVNFDNSKDVFFTIRFTMIHFMIIVITIRLIQVSIYNQ